MVSISHAIAGVYFESMGTILKLYLVIDSKGKIRTMRSKTILYQYVYSLSFPNKGQRHIQQNLIL